MAPERQAGLLRILDVHPGDRGTAEYNGEWIDILALGSVDLNGYSVVQAAGTASPTVLYTFAASLLVDEGDIVRIHAGLAPSNAIADGRIHRYRGSSAAPAFWMLDLAESEIRAIDPDGRPTGAISMAPGWIEREAHIVWNGDRTRLLVLPKARPVGCLFAGIQALPQWLQGWARALLAQPALNLESGTYRLEWQYIADIHSQNPEAPLLRRMGVVADESAVTQFRVS